MIAQDVVDRLAAQIPLYTSAFSDAVGVTDISVAGTTATVTTAAAHNLLEGENVSILGVDAPVQIDTATFLRVGSSATFETLQDHDLTLSARDTAAGGKTLRIVGATEVQFNGTFAIVRVVNRRKLIIAVTDSGPATISGAPLVADANGGVFNGIFPATNVTATTFEYTLPVAYGLDPVVDLATVQTSIRILSVLDIEQYLADVYTKCALDKDQLVVQLGDVSQSKNRNEETDAGSSAAGGLSYMPVLVQTFSVYIVQNVTDELSAAGARDRVEAEFVPAIFKAILRAEFASGFTYSQYRATFAGHLAQLSLDDMVGPDSSVALRDIGYTLKIDAGTGELLADVDLDEEPIP